jgi:hypothetical protein
MPKAPRSGERIRPADVPAMLAMVARGDRKHDITAWYGLNPGRIKNLISGQHGNPPLAPANQLPPAGSPGPRARAIRQAAQRVEQLLSQGDAAQALAEIKRAIAAFDIPV